MLFDVKVQQHKVQRTEAMLIFALAQHYSYMLTSCSHPPLKSNTRGQNSSTFTPSPRGDSSSGDPCEEKIPSLRLTGDEGEELDLAEGRSTTVMDQQTQ